MDKLCPACGHVDLWGVGRLHRSLIRRLFRREGVYKWTCSFKKYQLRYDSICGCRHAFHTLMRKV